MSKNTHADETGNDNRDARSASFAQPFRQNITPDRSKPGPSSTNIKAGPFGDSPPESGQSNNYYLFMMDPDDDDDNDNERDDDPMDEEDQLMHEYLYRLGTIQQRLQSMHLVDLDDDNRTYENGRMPNRGCTITEIFEEELTSTTKKQIRKPSTVIPTQKQIPSKHQSQRSFTTSPTVKRISKAPIQKSHAAVPTVKRISSEPCSSLGKNLSERGQCDTRTDSTNSPFSSTYSSGNSGKYKSTFSFLKQCDAASATENFEMDYNPPKKKHCLRESSPKVQSILSEGYMKYPFYKKNTEHCSTRSDNRKLLKHRKRDEECRVPESSAQTNEQKEEKILLSKSTSLHPSDTHIFPNVIIKTVEKSKNEEYEYEIELPTAKMITNDKVQKTASSSESSESDEYITYTKSDEISSRGSPRTDRTNSPSKISGNSSVSPRSPKNETNIMDEMLSYKQKSGKSNFAVVTGTNKMSRTSTATASVRNTEHPMKSEEISIVNGTGEQQKLGTASSSAKYNVTATQVMSIGDDRTLTTSYTSANSPSKKKTKSSRTAKNRVSTTEHMTLWEEVQKTHRSNDDEDDELACTNVIPTKSAILKDDSLVEKKSSTFSHIVSSCLDAMKRNVSSSASSVRGKTNKLEFATAEKQVEACAYGEIDTSKVPSQLLGSFRKSQQTDYHCYSASSHSTRSDKSSPRRKQRRNPWNLCMCFCNP